MSNMNNETTPRGRRAENGRPETRDGEGRRQRIPLGTPQAKLAAPVREGFVRRWLNDDGVRVQQAKSAGYDPVDATSDRMIPTDQEGSHAVRRVGLKSNGEPLNAILMEIPADWYREDQQAKQQQIDSVEASIKRAADKNGAVGKDGRYVPSRGISIQHDVTR